MTDQDQVKALKAAKLEGEQKARDINGLYKNGGVTYFTVTVESGNGDIKLVEEVAKALNNKAGSLAKAILSCDYDNDSLLASVNVPVDRTELSLTNWVEFFLGIKYEGLVKVTKIEINSNNCNIMFILEKDKGHSVLKLRDYISDQSYQFLVAQKVIVIPEEEDEPIYDF